MTDADDKRRIRTLARLLEARSSLRNERAHLRLIADSSQERLLVHDALKLVEQALAKLTTEHQT